MSTLLNHDPMPIPEATAGSTAVTSTPIAVSSEVVTAIQCVDPALTPPATTPETRVSSARPFETTQETSTLSEAMETAIVLAAATGRGK